MGRLIFILWFSLFAPPLAAETLIVGNKYEDTLSFIDLPSGKEVARVTAGPSPHEVILTRDGRQVVAVSYGLTDVHGPGQDMRVFDIASTQLVKIIAMPPASAPHGLAYAGDKLAVTLQGVKTLGVVDVATGAFEQIATDAEKSHMVAVSPDGSLGYVASMNSNLVNVLDLRAGTKVFDVATGAEPEGIAVSPDGTELWVANRLSGDVMVFDARTYGLLDQVFVGGVPIRLLISPDGRWVVTSGNASGEIVVLDRLTRSQVVSVPIEVGEGVRAKPVSMVFSPTGDRLFVALPDQAMVAEFDALSWSIKTFHKAGKGADGVALSPVDVKKIAK